MKEFKTNPLYLRNYNLSWSLFLTLAVLVMINLREVPLEVTLKPTDIVFLPIFVILMGPLMALFHNSFHGSVGGGFTNRILGELLGVFFLYGYQNFRLGHLLHHRHTGDSQRDPDYNVSHSFFGYLRGLNPQSVRALRTFHLGQFGDTEANLREVHLQCHVIFASMLVRLVFWFIFLGPKFFLFFYLPLAFGNFLIFCHINFYTHGISAEKKSILNVSGGSFLRYLNTMTFGGYQHNSHHLRPNLFDPTPR